MAGANDSKPAELTPEQIAERKKIVDFILAPYGRLFPKGSRVKSGPVFRAANPEIPETYLCGIGVEEMDGNPIIVSEQSGQVFVINWADLILLAREKGIDNVSLMKPEQGIEIASTIDSIEPKKKLIV